jgi:integrase
MLALRTTNRGAGMSAATDDRKLIRTTTPGVYKRGDQYVIRFRDPEGHQKQRSARTLAEARRMRSELMADVNRGEYRADSKVTFAEYAKTWPGLYTGRTGKGVRALTVTEYERDLTKAIAWFGRRKLSSIAPSDIKAYAASLAESGLAPATVRRLMAPVKVMLATAFEDGLIRSNPSAGVRLALPRAANAEHDDDQVKALDQDQLRKLVDSLTGWQQTMVVLAAESGLRIGELMGLEWGRVDIDGRMVQVRQRIRGTEVDSPKSTRSKRDVPISAGMAKRLAALRLAAIHSTDDDYVFATRTGSPHQLRNTYRWFKPAAEKAGAAWAGWHSLRHTAASRWLLGGVSIAQVSRLLGHADASFTLRVYISVMPADLPTATNWLRPSVSSREDSA